MASHAPPTRRSSDPDPLVTVHRGRATVHKTWPPVPCSAPFVERLIRTIRREYLDHVRVWKVEALTLERDRFRA